MTDAVTESLTTGDNQHPLESFFGPYRGTNESLRADDQLAHETYNLPKAYEGKNKFLEEVLSLFMMASDPKISVTFSYYMYSYLNPSLFLELRD